MAFNMSILVLTSIDGCMQCKAEYLQCLKGRRVCFGRRVPVLVHCNRLDPTVDSLWKAWFQSSTKQNMQNPMRNRKSASNQADSRSPHPLQKRPATKWETMSHCCFLRVFAHWTPFHRRTQRSPSWNPRLESCLVAATRRAKAHLAFVAWAFLHGNQNWTCYYCCSGWWDHHGR